MHNRAPQAHKAGALGDASLAGHTLVIPTYNRPALLCRLVTHYAEHARPLKLLVLDSSKPAIAAENAAALKAHLPYLRHVVYPTTTPMAAKLVLGLRDVATPTVSFCADDDIVFTDGLRQARNFLLDNPDYVCAHGFYLNFREDGFQIHITREYAGESNEANHPGARIFRLCQNYESVFYGVFRTGDLHDILAEAASIPSLHYQELFQSVGALIKGKIKRLQCFYAGRRSGPEAEPNSGQMADLLLVRRQSRRIPPALRRIPKSRGRVLRRAGQHAATGSRCVFARARYDPRHLFLEGLSTRVFSQPAAGLLAGRCFQRGANRPVSRHPVGSDAAEARESSAPCKKATAPPAGLSGGRRSRHPGR